MFILFLFSSLCLIVTSIIVVFSAIGISPDNMPHFIDLGFTKESIEHIAASDEDMEKFEHIFVGNVLYNILCFINLISAFVFVIPVLYLLT